MHVRCVHSWVQLKCLIAGVSVQDTGLSSLLRAHLGISCGSQTGWYRISRVPRTAAALLAEVSTDQIWPCCWRSAHQNAQLSST